MKSARAPLFVAVLAAAVSLAAALPVHAQKAAAEPLVRVTLEARKVVPAANGRETLSSADAVRPGDVIEYAATYRNTTRDVVRNLEPTLPIPQHTELVAGSARPAGVRASLDAREFAAPPLKRKTVIDGRETIEAIPLREYRFLRWQPVTLAAEAALTFTARVRVVE